MKAYPIRLVALFAITLLFVASLGEKVNLRASAKYANTQSTGNPPIPAFLEKGKTYRFSFVVGSGGSMEAFRL